MLPTCYKEEPIIFKGSEKIEKKNYFKTILNYEFYLINIRQISPLGSFEYSTHFLIIGSD